MRFLLPLVALLAIAGTAAAQSPCPECDPDGADNVDNTYHSVDVGAVTDKAEAVADTDAAHSHEGVGDGFWAWLALCLSAWVDDVENALGLDLGLDADARAEAYVSENGVDLDVTLADGGEVLWDFDESELGDLDGLTWEAAADAKASVGDLPASTPGIPEYEGADVDACAHADLGLEC